MCVFMAYGVCDVTLTRGEGPNEQVGNQRNQLVSSDVSSAMGKKAQFREYAPCFPKENC